MPFTGNTEELIHKLGAKIILEPPEKLEDLPENKALICMMDTDGPVFLGWCNDNHTFEMCTHPDNKRFKIWFLIAIDTAKAYFV